MSESTLTNLDGIRSNNRSIDPHIYHPSMMRTPNIDNNAKSMTIIVQNPFDDPTNSHKYSSSDDLSTSHNQIPSHPVRFNQELLDNFGITVPLSKQTDHSSASTTSLIPIPSSLSNNLGINIHQPSLTPTMIGTYNYHQQTPNGIYINNSRPMVQPRPSNGNILRYPSNQQYVGHQMIKPHMMPPNAYNTPIIYDQNPIYRTNVGQPQPQIPDDNILKTLLQITPDITQTSQMPVNAKSRKKRKPNDLNTSVEEDVPTKSRKRKKKGAEETEKFVEYSLQKLRDLPMLTPIEPSIDIKHDLTLDFPEIKFKSQGEFGDVFIENLKDHYRPYRREPLKPLTNERHYRVCSNILDHPPSLPSPPLMENCSEKLIQLIKDNDNDDESIISTSTLADDDDEFMNEIENENRYLLPTLYSIDDQELKALSPVIVSNENQDFDQLKTNDRPIVDRTDKVSVTLTLTTEAANNVQSVIAAVADLLKIAYPSTIDVHQTVDNNNNCIYSASINNSNKNDILSLVPSSSCQIPPTNRSTSIYKIGRETNTSIQTLIDMQPKICRYCSQILTTETLYKKRFNELPVNLRELTPNAEPFVYFCNEQCYNTYLTYTYQQIKTEPIDVLLTLKRPNEKVTESIDTKRWKRWDPTLLTKTIIEPTNVDEINKLIDEIRIPLPSHAKQDKRICVFCQGIGDMTSNGSGRLLNFEVGQWCHLNCALWSTEVYETRCGALMSVEQAYVRSLNIECVICKEKGSSLSCFYQRCTNTYHLTCAMGNGCVFYKNKTIMCPMHASKTIPTDEILEDKAVLRKVWINRDEIKQIQNYMNEEHEDKSYILRIGSLILHSIGQLLPHQLQSSAFHNRNFIYPVGYSVTRFYWSIYQPNRRCAYLCSIIDIDNKPMFRIRVQDNETEQEEEFLESTAKDVWHKIVNKIDLLRRKHRLVKMFSSFVKGEDLFGLTEPHIIRLIESLPGVEMLQNYVFKYGRLQLFEMPLTVNPTGCARSEPLLRTHFRRHALTLTSSHSTRSALPRTVLGTETPQIPYVKQFVLSKSTQYRKLKTEWRQNIYLAKSRIQGLGLFAARDLEKHTMVIEYIGELIRNEVANKREKLYEQQNRGIYMFRLDDDYVVDATMSGCLARYINHSCEPNSIAEVVQIEKENKIIIITNRRIAKGEELMYDYKFDFEEDSKIPCLCGAVNCRKWMN